jgi:predicted  nucleic acid-binding Zn-ribbon protein
MKDLQSIFNHIQEMKKRMKEIKKEYADMLTNADDYEPLLEEIKTLRDRKKQIEIRAQEQMGQRYAELEELKDETASEQEMLNDIAMTTLMDGKTVEVLDEYQNRYEPLFTVKFKKAQ